MTLLAKRKGNSFPSLVSDFFGSDDFFSSDLFDLGRNLSRWEKLRVPSVNIRETDKEFSLELAAPGLAKKDFKVELDNNGLLTISSEKTEEKNEAEKNFTRREFSYNSFCRSFQLPENSVSDKVDAKYEDGILKVTIPKKEVTVTKAAKEIKVA